MIFYLSAKYMYRDALLPIAAKLFMAGHTVQAEWIRGFQDESNTEHEYRKSIAYKDLQDVMACDAFVLFNFPIGDPAPSSGRHVEFGYALATGKRTIVVGSTHCVFATITTEQYDTVEQFLTKYA